MGKPKCVIFFFWGGWGESVLYLDLFSEVLVLLSQCSLMFCFPRSTIFVSTIYSLLLFVLHYFGKPYFIKWIVICIVRSWNEIYPFTKFLFKEQFGKLSWKPPRYWRLSENNSQSDLRFALWRFNFDEDMKRCSFSKREFWFLKICCSTLLTSQWIL